MELQFFGANCFKVTTKRASIVIDDNLSDLGAKSPLKADDIVLYTGPHAEPGVTSKITIDQPGEYEVSNTSIHGVAARAHIDEEKQHNATIFKITTEDMKVLIVGHVYPELTDEQVEEIGLVDIMLLPIGGNGYTLDAVGAQKIIKKIEPKLVIPSHYADKTLKYPVPQQELKEVLPQLGIEVRDTLSKLKVKSGELPEMTQVVVLES